jgi:hypothetical protein
MGCGSSISGDVRAEGRVGPLLHGKFESIGLFKKESSVRLQMLISGICAIALSLISTLSKRLPRTVPGFEELPSIRLILIPTSSQRSAARLVPPVCSVTRNAATPHLEQRASTVTARDTPAHRGLGLTRSVTGTVTRCLLPVATVTRTASGPVAVGFKCACSALQGPLSANGAAALAGSSLATCASMSE